MAYEVTTTASSRARSTCCSTSSCASRSTCTRSRWPPSSTPTWPSWSGCRSARPRRGHRVPAHRRHAGRAEGPPPAARAATTSTSTRSWPCGRSATCCWPACSSARRSRTRPPCWPRLADVAGAVLPAAAVVEERFVALTPDLLEGVTPDDAAAAPSCGPPRPSRCPASTWPTSRPIRASVADAVAELVDELPRVGRITLPPAHRGARRAPRGHRALPRRPRAVQAGPGRAGPGADVRRHRGRRGPAATWTLAVDDLARRRRRTRAERAATTPSDPGRRGRRAIEAIVMVADRAGRARSCWPSCSSCRSATVEAAVPAPGRGLRGRRPRLPAGARRRRLPLPEPSRPGALRRALRAGGPERPPVGGRPRDPGHRRLQAADLPGPDGGHPRRRPRRRDAHAAEPRATSTEVAPRSRSRPGRAVGHHAAVPRAAGPGLARRPAAARRLRARRRRGRGARGRACGRRRLPDGA